MKPYIRSGLIWTFGALVIMAATVFWAASQLPTDTPIPIHWNANGEPDGFANARTALMTLAIMPATTLFIGALLAAAPYIDPRKTHIDRGSKALSAVWIGVLVLLTLINIGIAVSMVKGATGDFNTGSVVRWIIAGTALFMMVIGNYLPKTRSNFMIGVRTPWTLSSDYTWEKTHRLAGRLFVVAGALGIVGAFALNGIWLALQLSILMIGAAIVSVVYSYLVWRTADDRDMGSGQTV